MVVSDWNPAAYAAFRDLRLRPALDLLAQVPELPTGDVIDLGCGAGAACGALATRFPARRLIGLDGSAAMLGQAAGYAETVQVDIATWQPGRLPALIFSNAALQWLPNHDTLLPRLADAVVPGGTLAVQMPVNYMAPSHRFLRDIAQAMFPGKFDFTGYRPPVLTAAEYWALLSPLGALTIWETEYLQPLGPVAQGHPVRSFTASTAMRPFLDTMTPEEAARFTARYDEALDSAYPRLPDGGALFPFRRLFLILTRP